MKVKAILPGLYMLPGMVNVYLIAEPDGYVLIDTGFPKSAEKILKGIETVGVAPGQIRHIILTHGHPDHIGSAAALKKATGATVYARSRDQREGQWISQSDRRSRVPEPHHGPHPFQTGHDRRSHHGRSRDRGW